MEPSLEHKITNLWGLTKGTLFDKLVFLKDGLLKWEKNILAKPHDLKRSLIKKFKKLIEEERTDAVLTDFIDTKLQLNMEVEKEEVFWEQRAWNNWLRLGDKNDH